MWKGFFKGLLRSRGLLQSRGLLRSRSTRRFLWSREGQSATEYMLIIAVVVIGLLAAASKLVPMFRKGVVDLGTTINEKYLSNRPEFCDPTKDDC